MIIAFLEILSAFALSLTVSYKSKGSEIEKVLVSIFFF